MPITNLDYQVMCSRFLTRGELELIIMIPISEKEETELDSGSLITVRNGFGFSIDKTNVICYGEIDFNTNSDDYNVIEGMNWLDHITLLGIGVPSDYDYKTHCCYSPIKVVRHYDTNNPAVVAQYTHARLGKPQRCCIFKEKRNGIHRVA